MMPRLLLYVLAALAGVLALGRGAVGASGAEDFSAAQLDQLLNACFNLGDRNHNGRLEAREINWLIENPAVQGNMAAAAVILHQHLPQDDEDGAAYTREKVSALAAQPQARREFLRAHQRILASNRALFLPGDPNLATFQQGRLGDCYLLSTVGALVNRAPGAVRAMIRPLAANAYEVVFADGERIPVPPITDAELVLGAITGVDHGIWLCVLEKAYAALREGKPPTMNGHQLEASETLGHDLLSGGRTGPVIEQMTGHRAADAPVARWAAEDPKLAADRLHQIFINLTRKRRVITAGTLRDANVELPRGIKHAHAFAILGYDPTRRLVRLFNPWGNELRPEGPAGLTNGYPTHFGLFEVPINDFIQIFAAVVYESDYPLH